MFSLRFSFCFSALVLVLSCVSSSALAAFITPDSWSRGDKGSAYLEWDKFSGRVNTSPDVGSNNIASSTLTERVGNSFVTSSGNLYSFLSEQSYGLSVIPDTNGPSAIAQDISVMLQIRTWSFEIKEDLVTLNGQKGAVTKLFEGRDTHPVFGDFTRHEYLFKWDVSASSIYQFAWDFDKTSTSLDAVVLDMYSSGDINDFLAMPNLPVLPALPGSTMFDGQTQHAVNDFVAPVPLPASIFMLFPSLAGLFAVARKRPA